jgi:hypothetical protein
VVEYRFRLTGVPPDQAIKLIEVEYNHTVADVKKNIQRAFKLCPILAFNLIYRGKVLSDTIKFGKIGVRAKNEVVTVMATQWSGATFAGETTPTYGGN